MDGLAGGFGVSKSTIYARYGSKAGLLRAVMKRGEPLLSNILEEVSTDPKRNPEEVLREYGRRIQQYANDPMIRALWRAVSDAREELEPYLEEVRESSGLSVKPIARYFAEMKRRGRLAPVDPGEAAICFSELASGGVTRFLGAPMNKSDLARALDTAVELFLYGVWRGERCKSDR